MGRLLVVQGLRGVPLVRPRLVPPRLLVLPARPHELRHLRRHARRRHAWVPGRHAASGLRLAIEGGGGAHLLRLCHRLPMGRHHRGVRVPRVGSQVLLLVRRRGGNGIQRRLERSVREGLLRGLPVDVRQVLLRRHHLRHGRPHARRRKASPGSRSASASIHSPGEWMPVHPLVHPLTHQPAGTQAQAGGVHGAETPQPVHLRVWGEGVLHARSVRLVVQLSRGTDARNGSDAAEG
mmetsp:Transcript_20145/g.42731  ORF Transcript_20145/g.42731 Transcript_20145/m.42731 type:complete len:236 (+) Transcript_20145:251-958(+)